MNELPLSPHHAELAPGDTLALATALADHPFTNGFDADTIGALSSHAATIEVSTGGFILRRGQKADALYLIVDGDIAVEIDHPTGDPVIVETLHGGDALGWSWLYEPHRWQFDAQAISNATAIAVDASALHDLLNGDPEVGRTIAMRMGRVLADRLSHARTQLASVVIP